MARLGSAGNAGKAVDAGDEPRQLILLAAASSIRNRVRWVPCAPAAGHLSSASPASARATASAFSAPEARIHTSRAARMAGKVSEIRVGGGLGELRTATTVPWAYAAGDSGKIDAT